MMDCIHDYIPVAVAVFAVLMAIGFTWWYAKSEGRLEGRAEANREFWHTHKGGRL